MTRLALTLLILLAFTLPAPAQDVTPDRWLLKAGDDPAYARADFDDGLWSEAAVPAAWETQGLDDYDGIAWYRTHFDVPAALVGSPLTLLLGRVDDADETFLNGVKIGQTGAFPPHGVSKWDVPRVYAVPPGLLKPRGNVLAVRVYDMGAGGGISTGPVGFYTAKGLQAELHPPPGPRASYFQPVTSNGLVAAVLDARTGVVTAVFPHIFQAHDEKHLVRPLLRLVRPTALPPPRRVGYVDDTHVIEADYGDVKIDWFAPFLIQEKVLCAVVRGPAAQVEKFSLTWPGAPHSVTVRTDTRKDGELRRYYFLSAENTTARARFHLLEEELDGMRATFARCHIPDSLTSAERATFRQSIAVLKMAQVSPHETIAGARGQILASLPPGVWNITWVRDGYYSTLALSRLGLFDEARRFLAFELGADSGHYADFKSPRGVQVGVGKPYRISVCRYFGDGIEEADGGKDPNIELDGFGLFLSAYSDYVTRSGDRAFYEKTKQQVRAEVADVVVHCIGEDGLIRPESGPWERHLKFKRFAWTSIVSAAGLRAFARLDPQNDRYNTAAARIEKGVSARLVTEAGWIRGNAETVDPTAYDSHDGGTFEAFATGQPWASGHMRTHFTEYDKVMRLPGRGYIRINKGDAYETGEWILMDLRAASAWALTGDTARAKEMLDWVTGQASRNFNLIPEMYSPSTWAYDGSIPMVGFGAGAYILAVCDLYGRR